MPSAGDDSWITGLAAAAEPSCARAAARAFSLDQEKQLPFTLNGHLSINKDYHIEW
jgi:hypothetical protein